MYTLEEDIIHFVFIAFHGKERKKEKIAMAYHSIMVGNMIKNAGFDEKIVNIGYLHDVIEDTDYTYEDIKERFGKEIADGVLKVTDEESDLSWKERKEIFVEKIRKSDNDTLIVELADKLQNLISDYDRFLEKGKDSLMTESDSYQNFKWYYNALKDIFNERLEKNTLLDRYNEITNIYFN